MKRILFILIVSIPFLGYSQRFLLTPNGFVNKDTNQNFVVIDINQKKQQGMYEAVKSSLEKILNSRIETINENEYSNLSVVAVFNKKRGGYDFKYKINYEFRDGAVKIDIIFLEVNKDDKYIKLSKGYEESSNAKKYKYIYNEQGKKLMSTEYFEDFSDDVISKTKKVIKQSW